MKQPNIFMNASARAWVLRMGGIFTIHISSVTTQDKSSAAIAQACMLGPPKFTADYTSQQHQGALVYVHRGLQMQNAPLQVMLNDENELIVHRRVEVESV
ncbi:hypothetical protein B0H94_10322 [Salsuginibacillus halophilus]|uniref:Fe-S cluster assembly iron-binding protein IscA n=1 Tax=Salsuginibacillus halophilus TaxID=517424 RepID=A0A2P8HVY7_9BACI|nr:hypothetical protein [Salsuginibacillus halophilus]PSL50411.1 hypothetical protein B0H94_10322 [Salsuginibacillus halophilus]